MTKDPTYILCIEVANAVASVAIAKDGDCMLVKEVIEPNKAADKLHILIQELMKEVSISFSELKAIAISAGPGSYTGLRIASAAAKGFCFSLDIPMIAIPTFEGMVYGIQKRFGFIDLDQYVPMIDARRMEVFLSFYSKEIKITRFFSNLVINNDFGKLFDANQKYILFGNGASKANLLGKENIKVFEGFMPSAHDLCLLAFYRFSNKIFEDIVYFEPNYSKPFYTTPSNKKQTDFN